MKNIPAKTAAHLDFDESGQAVVAKDIEKDFHVSPFMSMDMHYDMKFTIAHENSPNNAASQNLNTKLAVSIANFRQGIRVFDVAMSLKSKPITSTNLWLSLLKYPLISWKVFAGIYWQAGKLYWKRVPFVPHPGRQPGATPENPGSQTDSQSAAANSESVTNEKSDKVLAG